MTAMVPFFQWMNIEISQLSKQELLILEAELFVRTCEELKKIFREKYKDYFCLIKLTKEMESVMLETSFIHSIIQDILSTQEYTLQGIAEYIDFHEDVIIDVITGRNLYPSSRFLKRLIELHRSVKTELYQEIIKKIKTNDILCFDT